VAAVTALGLGGVAGSTLLFAAIPSASSAAASTLEVRLAERHPGVGLSAAVVPGSDEKIYLHPEAVITNADVVSAHVIPGDQPGTFNVGIMFSPEGSAKIEKATQAHLNEPLAILVNGRVVSAPTLRSQIRGSAVISGDLTSAEANSLAASLNSR
jgi:preprotein translocase subunit SecD